MDGFSFTPSLGSYELYIKMVDMFVGSDKLKNGTIGLEFDFAT